MSELQEHEREMQEDQKVREHDMHDMGRQDYARTEKRSDMHEHENDMNG